MPSTVTIRKLRRHVADPACRYKDLHRPFLLTIDGREWAVASDARSAVAVKLGRGASRPASPSVPGVGADLAGWFSGANNGPCVDLPALRKWAGSPRPLGNGKNVSAILAYTGECPKCKGVGSKPCSCDCGHVHKAACSSCERGKAELGPLNVDRALLASRLAGLRGKTARVRLGLSEFEAARIDASDGSWRVLLMPFNGAPIGEPFALVRAPSGPRRSKKGF